MKYWETIADKLSKSGWSLGWVSAIDSEGRTIWIADVHLPIAGDKDGYPKRLASGPGSQCAARVLESRASDILLRRLRVLPYQRDSDSQLPGESRAPLPSCARWTPEQKNSEYFLLDTCRRTCNSCVALSPLGDLAKPPRPSFRTGKPRTFQGSARTTLR